jgi:hypothetical protein
MELHYKDLSQNILYANNYVFNRNPPKNYDLFEKILSYFDGYSHKIIPLKYALSYPIIYDTYIDSNEEAHDITILLCPFTLSAVAIEGIFYATKYTENYCLVITNNIDTFSILNSYQMPQLKKIDVSIKVLRNMFTQQTDSKYLDIKQDIKIPPNIMPSKYYTSLIHNMNRQMEDKLNIHIHDKTLVYVIIYTSSSTNNFSKTILIGKNSTMKKKSGYNIVKSGIYKYLAKYENKIKEKSGLVVPVLWFACQDFASTSHILRL